MIDIKKTYMLMVNDISKRKAWFIRYFIRTYEIRLYQIGGNKKVIIVDENQKTFLKENLIKRLKLFLIFFMITQ